MAQSPSEMEQLLEGDSLADDVYRWSVRIMYATLIGLNVYLYLEMANRNGTLEPYKQKGRQIIERLREQLPPRFTKSKNRVLYEAEQIVSDDAA
jgi:hypothetical protein